MIRMTGKEIYVRYLVAFVCGVLSCVVIFKIANSRPERELSELQMGQLESAVRRIALDNEGLMDGIEKHIVTIASIDELKQLKVDESTLQHLKKLSDNDLTITYISYDSIIVGCSSKLYIYGSGHPVGVVRRR
jgi:hypothetical protein